ncbi:hypothetical protein CHU95_14855 [Niveispirillum lacus]|uniref:3-oxoacyl-ACP synthase n=1 Tax=Niveispirillum lacus TaxID=1981099 RepID=A0A255YWN6_9PROT|nr:BrnA antitoxin family protein [Niveispirillum lacus]OYQ33646.1 hypothetical protein CHU95_14855 [Niveispirillum lacus]
MSFPGGMLITPAERAALLGPDRPDPMSDRPRWSPARPRGRDRRDVTLRLDGDLIDWFRRHGGGHRAMQARINAALRAYMADHDAEE